MDVSNLFARARRGLREDLRLYLMAVTGLSVAFFCLGALLLGLANLGRVSDQWGRMGRMTVYLADGVSAREAADLRSALEALPDVREVRHVTAADAREQFVEQAGLSGEAAELPPDVFPASLEVALAEGTSLSEAESLAARIGRFSVVAEVDTYRTTFSRLEALLGAGQAIALALAIIVLFCAAALVSGTIRLAVATRRDEVEIMKLCGATDAFVRGPFVVEGALQGLGAATIAVAVLAVLYAVTRSELNAVLATFAGTTSVFVGPLMILGLLASGALMGALGSRWSLGRYLAI